MLLLLVTASQGDYNSMSSPGDHSSWQGRPCSPRCTHARSLLPSQFEGFLFLSTSPAYPLHVWSYERALCYLIQVCHPYDQVHCEKL